MAADSLLSGAGLDQYSLMARLRPALLAVLPVLLTIGYWVPASVLTTLGLSVTALGAFGVTYLLSIIARTRGLARERALGPRAGRRRSARLLTFADDHLPRDTKARYHSFLADKGCRLSSPEEEASDPTTAFERARSAVDRLLVLTKQPRVSPRLYHETVAYGFVRNLRGLKAIALFILGVSLAVNGALTWINRADHSVLTFELVIACVLLAAAAAWTFLVTDDLVCSASTSYGERFLEHCEGAPAPERAGGN